MEKQTVGIIGATGYAGAELIRLLAQHPAVEIVKIGVRTTTTENHLSQIYPGLSCKLPALTGLESSFSQCQYVFLALPHGVSMGYVPRLLAEGCRVIDLGADFRFPDPVVYANTYELEHQAPELLVETVYGLPEYFREQIRQTKLIGNPGCYPTAVLLGLKPLLDKGLVEKEGIVIDAKSGATGAGRGLSQDRLFTELNDNFRAYKVVGHRHGNEICFYAGKELKITFSPHLLPLQRGILATSYLTLSQGVGVEEVARAYQTAYSGEPFIQAYPQGVLPELRWVVGSNNCQIGYAYDPKIRRLIVVSVIDNLIKGAAGQAIQNFNIMAGLPETMGLPQLAPVV